MEKVSKHFFLLSLLPAIAYWYLDEYYPVKVALIGGLSRAVVEMAAEYLFTKKIHSISKFNFVLILILGGISLIGDTGIWFKLQPSFAGVVMGFFLIVNLKRSNGLVFDLVKENQKFKHMPPQFFKMVEFHMSIFLIAYGILMAFVAIHLSTSIWLFMKTFGFYIAFFIFMFADGIYIRMSIRRQIENQMKTAVLSRFNTK